jgi:hypothetical protein
LARVAVFVDAGYLIARAAEALTGAAVGRRGVILDETRVISDLIAFAEAKAHCPGELLRVYWYDAAGALPTAEHIRLAELDDVKLRLGTLNSVGQQKGVDSLIIADMIELSRNHASDSFVLVGGDEDLRVGVQVAQTYGIRVHLLGVEINGSKAQSAFLAREVDTNSGWTAAEVARFLAIRPAPPAAPIVAPVQTPVVAQPALETGGAAAAQPQNPTAEELLERVAKEFYETLTPTDLGDIRTVWTASQSIPQPHDGRLLARSGVALGRPLDVPEKREMRRIFTRLLEAYAG